MYGPDTGWRHNLRAFPISPIWPDDQGCGGAARGAQEAPAQLPPEVTSLPYVCVWSTVLWTQLTAPGKPAQQLSVASGFPAFQNCLPGGPPDSASTCTVHSGGNRKLGLSLHIHQNGEMAVPLHGDMIGIKCLEACLHTVRPLCLCVLIMRPTLPLRSYPSGRWELPMDLLGLRVMPCRCKGERTSSYYTHQGAWFST